MWAFVLSGSRGAQVGLGAALLASVFFGLRGKWKILPIVLIVAFGVFAWLAYANAAQASRAGRGESLRLRGYAWSYALRMVRERPVTGYGQGGYALVGDSFAADDVLDDPPVFEGSVDHAHNEWLETLGDLGIVGGALIGAVLILTLLGVNAALQQADAEGRWWLIGLGGALVGLVVEECAGVGLRISEVPVAFYTVLGLTWAAALPDGRKLISRAEHSKWIGLAAGGTCLVLGLATMSFTQMDFRSARSMFDMQQLLSQGKLDDAVEIAEAGTWRLSPQRALASRFAIIDAYVQWAEHTIRRATERNQKARGSEPPDGRVLSLAQADIIMAEEAVRKGGHALKELVERSPGYFNSGALEFRIHLVRAQAGLLRDDREAAEASRKNVVAALERELTRQPFRADLAVSYARFARSNAHSVRILTVLARPLRYGPITDDVAQAIQQLAQAPDVQQVLSQSIAPAPGEEATDPGQVVDRRWLPELLRVSAALYFMSGQYEQAAVQLEQAGKFYESLTRPATLGEAAASLEAAEALLYADPDHPEAAIAQAQQAIALAPQSRLGRELQNLAKQRMVAYHLASEQESAALDLLKKSTAKNVSEEVSRRELGLRLRSLTESMLLRRREAVVLRKAADSLMPKLQRWISRAIELNPDDYPAHYIAADLALQEGDDAAAARHIRSALQLGLDPGHARQFVQMALERKPESPALQALARELPPADLASGQKGL